MEIILLTDSETEFDCGDVEVKNETDFECGEIEVKNEPETGPIKNDKKHICTFSGCHSSFNRPWKLERHIWTHTNQRPYKCDFPGCTKDYTNKSHLDRHKALTHAENKPPPVYIPCPFPDCNKVFMNKWSLKKHTNNHKNKQSYSCRLCGVDFSKYKQLQDHINTHIGIFPYPCGSCEMSYQTRKELKVHEKKHKVYTCDEEGCREVFSSWNALRTHSKIAHSKSYNCDSCGKTYTNKWTLTEHVLSHLPVDKRDVIMCPYVECGRYYFHQRNLNAHVKSFHQDINFKCDAENCGRSFTKKIHLEKHKRLHEEPKILSKPRPKSTKPRKPRKDKGIPRKSMAAMLSGVVLPESLDKTLAQSSIASEILECIQQVKDIVAEEKEKAETSENV